MSSNEYNFNTENQLLLGKRSKGKNIFLKLKRKIFAKVFLIRIAIIILIVVLLIFLGKIAVNITKDTAFMKMFVAAKNFIYPDYKKIKIINNRVNILILGKGGDTHESPDLTDSIMLGSISFSKNKIDLLSLPRDIWITPLRTKLNSIYYWGNKKQKDGGLIMAKSTVEEILGTPVPYSIVVDFEGLIGIVDALGGISINIENSFIDEKYPIIGKENDLCGGDIDYKCRYEIVNFEKGQVLMNGSTALKFVRSRNAKGDEGTDIARSNRQQKVVMAMGDRLFDRQILLSPSTLKSIKNIFLNNIETDIGIDEAAIIIRQIFKAKDNIISHNFPIDLFEIPLSSPLYNNLYVFITKTGDWNEVRNWVDVNLN